MALAMAASGIHAETAESPHEALRRLEMSLAEELEETEMFLTLCYAVADPAQGTLTRVSRQQHNAWHRELHAAVTRLFAALAERDEQALATVVPDPALRASLPALVSEPACDAADGVRETVSIAATSADRRPWSLTFRRAGVRWRLTAAAPVMQ